MIVLLTIRNINERYDVLTSVSANPGHRVILNYAGDLVIGPQTSITKFGTNRFSPDSPNANPNPKP